MYVEDGTVKVLHVEENPGTCEVTAGESLLAEI
jgi:cytochrome c peroxidase